MSEEEHTLRAAPGRRAVEEWALVLAAAGIAHRVAGNAGSWRLLVAAGDADRSIAALDAYDAERRNAAPGEEVPEYGPTYAGLLVAVLLVGFYGVTGPADPGSAWARAAKRTSWRISSASSSAACSAWRRRCWSRDRPGGPRSGCSPWARWRPSPARGWWRCAPCKARAGGAIAAARWSRWARRLRTCGFSVPTAAPRGCASSAPGSRRSSSSSATTAESPATTTWRSCAARSRATRRGARAASR